MEEGERVEGSKKEFVENNFETNLATLLYSASFTLNPNRPIVSYLCVV